MQPSFGGSAGIMDNAAFIAEGVTAAAPKEQHDDKRGVHAKPPLSAGASFAWTARPSIRRRRTRADPHQAADLSQNRAAAAVRAKPTTKIRCVHRTKTDSTDCKFMTVLSCIKSGRKVPSQVSARPVVILL
jgi:hypothetical protein